MKKCLLELCLSSGTDTNMWHAQPCSAKLAQSDRVASALYIYFGGRQDQGVHPRVPAPLPPPPPHITKLKHKPQTFETRYVFHFMLRKQ
jgi:hypothetical protein